MKRMTLLLAVASAAAGCVPPASTTNQKDSGTQVDAANVAKADAGSDAGASSSKDGGLSLIVEGKVPEKHEPKCLTEKDVKSLRMELRQTSAMVEALKLTVERKHGKNIVNTAYDKISR